MTDTVAPTTAKAYGTGLRQWKKFVEQFDCASELVNPSEQALSGFVAWLASPFRKAKRPLGIRASSISNYLRAIRLAHVTQGLPNPLANAPLVDCLLRGV